MKFEAGQKVVPLRKSIMGDLDSSLHWRRSQAQSQGFLYVSYFRGDGTVVCASEKEYDSGDYFHESDLVPYKERKFEIGQKVVPVSKSVYGYGDLESSGVWKSNKSKGFMYVAEYRNDYIVCTREDDFDGGDYFKESDLVPYEETEVGIAKVITVEEVTVRLGDELVIDNETYQIVMEAGKYRLLNTKTHTLRLFVFETIQELLNDYEGSVTKVTPKNTLT